MKQKSNRMSYHPYLLASTRKQKTTSAFELIIRVKCLGMVAPIASEFCGRR